jgi:small-conductance mechanosensitive channel
MTSDAGGPPPRPTEVIRGIAVVLLVAGVLAGQAAALAAEQPVARDGQAGVPPLETELQSSAPVEIDGQMLFRVRGVSAYPAPVRAAAIAGRIEALAADASVPADAVRPVEIDEGTGIYAGSHLLMVVQDADARMESVDRKVLAFVTAQAIRAAVVDYRQARSRTALAQSTLRSGVATAILAAACALVIWVSRRAHAALERRYRRRIHSIDIQSLRLVRAEQIWNALQRLLGGARAIVLLVLGFVHLQYVLGLFPWTRGTARRLLAHVLDPLGVMGRGLIASVPDVLFLAVLCVLTRYVLMALHVVLAAVGRGEIKLRGFERDWAEPTYKLLRVGVIVLALVVSYPYIPGSGSDAFKGLTIFLGVLLSLGSSSAIANLIAGYSMTYRRAFRVGDRVKIGDTMGDVTEMRLQATHLRTIKNEEVIIPNSAILNNAVVNYSSLARRGGLILHTKVGIGYETPWRQVEAMLLMAAERTPGLLKEPPPFVLQRALGDFAVTYELNVYSDDAQAMGKIYSGLHRNILDVFNEYGVQIMTPAYEGDPEVPKVVPKDQWFSAPAKAAEPDARAPEPRGSAAGAPDGRGGTA